MSSLAAFEFADLFAGIGGFHAALSALGGSLAIAAEKDRSAAATYKRNWGVDPFPDVVELANQRLSEVPPIDFLAGGFPCQPFSKSGRQRGMHEERGRVFDEMLKVIEARTPAVVMLENVRNITGPRQVDVWRHVIEGLRSSGYAVSAAPLILSPHRLAPELGGAPQSRERVFIMGTYVGKSEAEAASSQMNVPGILTESQWDPANWDLFKGYIEVDVEHKSYRCTPDEAAWLQAWGDFLIRTADIRLPGHPLWSDYWNDFAVIDVSGPPWKQRFERSNLQFWNANRSVIRAWQRANPSVVNFPASRRKLEWQAGDSVRDLSELLIHLRPSGIRIKRTNYTPALVAMTQTPLIGRLSRKMSPRECARLQSFPDWFEFDHQADKYTYRQLGNAVNVGVAYSVARQYVLANAGLIGEAPGGDRIVRAVRRSDSDPRVALRKRFDLVASPQ